MVSMDTLVMKIMNFAQRLVDADRASLFLVDSKNKELYATIFDVGVNEDTSQETGDSLTEDGTNAPPSREIRFPIGTGIAGNVAQTGEVLNIRDAYSIHASIALSTRSPATRRRQYSACRFISGGC